jgi:D-glycero-D-manno-heptose 1,7-bisphosphate phosphatase
MRPAVFLDRDGVINRAVVRSGRPYAPTKIEDFHILDGVPEAVGMLRAAGFLIVVVTNQPDIATGKQTSALLEQMHAMMRETVDIDAIYVCPHDDRANCACRKPKPGLLLMAAENRQIALDQSWLVGDRWRDIEAGQSAGCRTIYIDRGYAEPVPRADHVAAGLPEAVPFILQASRQTCRDVQ